MKLNEFCALESFCHQSAFEWENDVYNVIIARYDARQVIDKTILHAKQMGFEQIPTCQTGKKHTLN